jgi:hypothetical protein
MTQNSEERRSGMYAGGQRCAPSVEPSALRVTDVPPENLSVALSSSWCSLCPPSQPAK